VIKSNRCLCLSIVGRSVVVLFFWCVLEAGDDFASSMSPGARNKNRCQSLKSSPYIEQV